MFPALSFGTFISLAEHELDPEKRICLPRLGAGDYQLKEISSERNLPNDEKLTDIDFLYRTLKQFPHKEPPRDWDMVLRCSHLVCS